MVMETTGRTRFSAPGRHARRSSGVKAVNAPLRCAALAALLLLAVATSVRRVDAGEGALTFVIGAPSGNTVSPYLASMSIVYCWARDAMYSNGTMAAWARRNGLHTARYPAGTASYWNWENPSGIMGHSTLDPAWKGPPAPADQWMSLDEYLDLIDNVGRDVMKPLIGVNYNSHTHYYLSRNASIARAAAQVAHVVARGHTGAFWYVGNEDGAPQHATDIAAHARAMKQVDPTLKVFYNDNHLDGDALKAFLKTAGDVIDGAEFHGKWPFGGSPNLKPRTYQEWLKEVPLMEHKSGQTWRDKIAGLRAAAKEAGRPDLMLANNEFGLGKPAALVGFNRFTKGLVNVEFALEMYVAGYDMAAFWDNSDGGNPGNASGLYDQMLTDSSQGFRFNPSEIGISMLARAANGSRLTLANGETAPRRVHGFAVLKEDATNGPAAMLYLINKYETEANATVQLPSFIHAADSKRPPRLDSMVDTEDHWGTMTSLDSAIACTAAVCTITLPPVSFSVATFAATVP